MNRYHNFHKPKPIEWECTDYEYRKLQVLNSLSANLKTLGDRLDAVDATYSAEMLAEIVNSHARSIIDVVDKNNGYYSGNYTADTNNSGHYNGS